MSGIDLAEAAKRIAGDVEIAQQALISEEDAYYFQDSEHFVLPFYRVVLKDDESTRYYFDPRSGTLLQRADATARWYRWLFSGLHRINFTAWMRARPAWDIIMLTLMLGWLALTTTGFYLALQRIRNDIVLLSRLLADASRRLPKKAILRELMAIPRDGRSDKGIGEQKRGPPRNNQAFSHATFFAREPGWWSGPRAGVSASN